MSRALLITLVCLIAVPLVNAQQQPANVQQQQTAPAQPPPADAQPQPPKQDEAPPPTWEFGFEQRVRNENWNNIGDYNKGADDEREQIRYRTRIWANVPVASWLDAFVGLNQETNEKLGKVTHFDEVIFESAYLDFKKLFVKGLSLRVGRQNLMKGEGFVMLDGTPGDGSRSIYFNAVDLAYSWKKSKLELLGIMMPKYDRFFPTIHDVHKPLQNWDQSSAGFYYTDKNNKKMPFEAYYLYTKEVKDYLAPTNPQFQPDRHISALGGRIVRQFPQGWSATGEFVGEWGAQHPDVAVHGWGGYTYVKKTFTHRWKPYVLGGWWGMSGDDPKTKTIEGYDPLYGRWPKWSELYIYSQVPERGVAYWTNTTMWQAETGFAPRKTIAARFTYYHMGSFQPYTLGSQKVFGTGTDRGDNLQARIDYMPNKHWKAHVLYETQLPGNFYRHQDAGYFLRFELSYVLSTKLTTSALKHKFSGGDDAPALAPAAAASARGM